MAWLFTASTIVYTLTSDSDYGSPDIPGNNPTLDLKLGANYDIVLSDTAFSTAIRNNVSDTSDVEGVYNNDTTNGRTGEILMWSPKTAGTYYYVNTNNPSINGQIIVS